MAVISITSIIPNMIFGIVLIIGWLPIIIITEINNKGNLNELKVLQDEIKKNLKLTDIVFTFPQQTTEPNTQFKQNNDGTNIINLEYIKSNNNNLYIKIIKKTTTTDNKGVKRMDVSNDKIIIGKPLVDGNQISDDDYIYLALKNKVTTINNIADKNNNNITYDIEIYSIPNDKTFMKVEGLDEDKIDMTVNTYEFGPKDIAITSIINNKKNNNQLQMWGFRIGTFLMLFIGLSLIVSPLTALVQLGQSLPGPLQLLAIPGQIILGLYQSLSFFSSLLLTLLMTFLVWSIINMPLLSFVIGGLLIGLILYFQKK
jgi:hypothetical protein